MKFRTLAQSALLIAMVVAIFAGLAYRKKKMIEAAMSAPIPEEMEFVTTTKVGQMDLRAQSVAIGTVIAPQSIVLRNELSGAVREVHLKPGQVVDAGELLLRLDTNVEVAQLDAASAGVKIAQSTYERLQSAAKNNAAGELEVEQAAAQLAQAKAEQARLEAIIARKTIRAPFRARIGLSDTHLGQYLPEGTEITSLQGIDTYLFVDFPLAQAVADDAKVGQKVTLLLGQKELEGTLFALDSRADRVTRNLLARVKLDQPPEFLQPGDSVQVRVDYGPLSTVCAVPQSAIRYSPMGAQVFAVDHNADGKMIAKSRTVQVGSARDGQIAIVNGLEPGQQVIVNGSFKLRDGIVVVDASAAPATAASQPVSPSAGSLDPAATNPTAPRDAVTEAGVP
jgi:membrane fusion protein, multidrug efflux system